MIYCRCKYLLNPPHVPVVHILAQKESTSLFKIDRDVKKLSGGSGVSCMHQAPTTQAPPPPFQALIRVPILSCTTRVYDITFLLVHEQ